MIQKIFRSRILVRILIIMFFMNLFIYSCNKKSPKKHTDIIVNQFMEDTIILPEISGVLFKDSLYKKNILKSKNKKLLKITTFIDGECPRCINDLMKWNKFFQYAKSKKNLNIFFYFFTSDLKHFRNNIYTKDIYKFPLLLDRNYQYIDNNNLPFDKKHFQTFLLNPNNEVILVGNPIYSKKLQELYKKEIEKRIAE